MSWSDGSAVWRGAECRPLTTADLIAEVHSRQLSVPVQLPLTLTVTAGIGGDSKGEGRPMRWTAGGSSAALPPPTVSAPSLTPGAL